MATAVWSSSPADGDWTNASNWSGGSGAGGIPASSDTVVIADSSQDIDTNLTTGLTGCTVRFGPGYTGAIGSSGNELDIDGTLDCNSRGDVFITGTFTTVTVHGGNPSADMLNFKANASTDIGTLRIFGGLGTVTVGANAVLDTVEIADAPNAKLIIEEAVTSLDDVTMDSGLADISAPIAGTLTVRGGVATVDGSATVATLSIEPKGVVDYRSSGTIVTLNNFGVFDGRKNGSATVQITTPTSYEGSRWFLRNGMNTWKDSLGTVVYHGGWIDWPSGSLINVS
jgi:hypothetical protein